MMQLPTPIPNDPSQFIIQTDNDTLNLILGFRDNVGLGFGVGVVVALTLLVSGVKVVTSTIKILKIDTLFNDLSLHGEQKITVAEVLKQPNDVSKQVIDLQTTIIELQMELLKLKGG